MEVVAPPGVAAGSAAGAAAEEGPPPLERATPAAVFSSLAAAAAAAAAMVEVTNVALPAATCPRRARWHASQRITASSMSSSMGTHLEQPRAAGLLPLSP